MKSYEQWSARAKQLGWSPDQYSQAAYQGYVNNMQQQSVGGGSSGGSSGDTSGGSPPPMSYSPPPLETNNELEEQIKQLADALEDQSNQNQILLNKLNQKPVDASKAMNSTLLTGNIGFSGDQEKKQRSGYLSPFGG